MWPTTDWRLPISAMVHKQELDFLGVSAVKKS
jgi:hypothetical protein